MPDPYQQEFLDNMTRLRDSMAEVQRVPMETNPSWGNSWRDSGWRGRRTASVYYQAEREYQSRQEQERRYQVTRRVAEDFARFHAREGAYFPRPDVLCATLIDFARQLEREIEQLNRIIQDQYRTIDESQSRPPAPEPKKPEPLYIQFAGRKFRKD